MQPLRPQLKLTLQRRRFAQPLQRLRGGVNGRARSTAAGRIAISATGGGQAIRRRLGHRIFRLHQCASIDSEQHPLLLALQQHMPELRGNAGNVPVNHAQLLLQFPQPAQSNATPVSSTVKWERYPQHRRSSSNICLKRASSPYLT